MGLHGDMKAKGEMMKKLLGGAAGLAVVAVIFMGGGDDAAAVERVGYFKSDDGARVMAYQAGAPLSDIEARAVLRAAPSTAGRVSMAVLYQPGSMAPGGELTTAPNLAAAARLIGEPPFNGWAVRLRVNPAGLQTFD